MRFIRYTSVLSVMVVCSMNSLYADAPQAPRPVYMTSQIQRLLNEKQEKISKLEECDGKRKGFMIAGISTIGLTAVGVGINIAQASKSNKLSNQIAEQNRQLEKQQTNLADINSQISDKQEENKRRECEAQEGRMYVNGQCVDKNAKGVNNNLGGGQLQSAGTVSKSKFIGKPCNESGSVWIAGGDQQCLPVEGATETVACSCPVESNTNQGGGETSLDYPRESAKYLNYEDCVAKNPNTNVKCVIDKRGMTWAVASFPTAKQKEYTWMDFGEAWSQVGTTKDLAINKKGQVSVYDPNKPVPDSSVCKYNFRSSSDWYECDTLNSAQGTNTNQRTKVEPIQAKPRTIDSIPTVEPQIAPLSPLGNTASSVTSVTRDATITGYCLDKNGDTGSLDESQKTFCWCDIYMVDYCAQSKLFDGQNGVCDLSSNAGAACQRFCESKKAEFISFCDSLH